VITGNYTDANSVYPHGFIRSRDGALETFDVPGATYTIPTGINPAGAIAGVYADANVVNHGFIRSRNGAFITFDPPDSVDTFPTSINTVGVIVGNYHKASGIEHGFLRMPGNHNDE
jgi:hypothetical protein